MIATFNRGFKCEKMSEANKCNELWLSLIFRNIFCLHTLCAQEARRALSKLGDLCTVLTLVGRAARGLQNVSGFILSDGILYSF